MSSPMAEVRHPNVPPKAMGKSKSVSTDFLCKLLVLASLMVAVPLFPVRAPDFLHHTLAIKYWEPIRLLFIGLAVSCACSIFYGRNLETDNFQVSYAEESQSSFVSRIFHVNPIFEDGYDYIDDRVLRFTDQIYVDKEIVRSEIAASSLQKVESFDDEVAPLPNEKPLGLPVRSLVSEMKDATLKSVTRVANEALTEKNGVEEEISYSTEVVSRSQSSRSSDSPPEERVLEEKTKSFRASYPPTPVTKEVTLNAFHLRRYSSGSLFKKTQLKDFGSSAIVGETEVPEKIREPEADDVAEKLRIGKSVRSFRSFQHLDTQNWKIVDTEKTAPEEIPAINLENAHIEAPKVPQRERRRKVKVDPVEEVVDFPQKSELLPSSDEGYESSEVDRKAGEFIAKFKQQIRLQKEASIDRSRASRLSSTHFR